jgi:hypothetical protein
LIRICSRRTTRFPQIHPVADLTASPKEYHLECWRQRKVESSIIKTYTRLVSETLLLPTLLSLISDVLFDISVNLQLSSSFASTEKFLTDIFLVNGLHVIVIHPHGKGCCCPNPETKPIRFIHWRESHHHCPTHTTLPVDLVRDVKSELVCLSHGAVSVCLSLSLLNCLTSHCLPCPALNLIA